jgi:hypothetical protein
MDIKRSRPINFGMIILFSADREKYVEYTNESGEFEFPHVKTGNYKIRFEGIGYRDTIFEDLTIRGDTSINLSYIRNCRYDDAINNSRCPKCKKKNRVIPIIYGLPVSLNGEDPTVGNGEKFILAGCEITDCDPNWFCRRNKISF